MKRIYQLLVVASIATLLFSACSANKKMPRGDIKGNWVVTSATVQGADGKIKTTAFDDVPVECFNGSQWKFPNNGYGSYTISGGSNCMAGERQIIWSVRTRNGVDYLQFKKMDGLRKKDAKDVDEGYALEISNYGGTSFTARSPLVFEGKTIYIVYNFSKQ